MLILLLYIVLCWRKRKNATQHVVLRLNYCPRLYRIREEIHFNVDVLPRDVQIAKIGRRKAYNLHTQCDPSRTRTPNEPNLFSLDALCIGFGFGSERGGRTHVHVIGNRVKKGSRQDIWTDININGHDAVLLYTHYIIYYYYWHVIWSTFFRCCRIESNTWL